MRQTPDRTRRCSRGARPRPPPPAPSPSPCARSTTHGAAPFACIASPRPLPRERSARRRAPAPGNCRRADAPVKQAPRATDPRPYPLLSCRCTSAPAATSALAVAVCPFNDARCSAVSLHRQPTPIAVRAIYPAPRPCPREPSSSRRSHQASPTCDTTPDRTPRRCLAGARPRPPPPAPSLSPCARSPTQRAALYSCTASPRPCRESDLPTCRRCPRELSSHRHARHTSWTDPRPYPTLFLRCTSAPAATRVFAVLVWPLDDATCSAVSLHHHRGACYVAAAIIQATHWPLLPLPTPTEKAECSLTSRSPSAGRARAWNARGEHSVRTTVPACILGVDVRPLCQQFSHALRIALTRRIMQRGAGRTAKPKPAMLCFTGHRRMTRRERRTRMSAVTSAALLLGIEPVL
jgi:hypothetical protein